MTSPCFVDLYAGDLDGEPDIPALVAAGLPWAGIGLKATEGTSYPSSTTSAWFKQYWPIARSAAGSRYGVDWFRFAYHYLRIDEDPIAQAEWYLRFIQSAGGWGDGDLWPMVDLESTSNPPSGSASKVVDVTTQFAERIWTGHGRRPILYAGSYVRDLGIIDHMGCQLLWTAAYASTLPSYLYNSMGWLLSSLFAWVHPGLAWVDRVGSRERSPR